MLRSNQSAISWIVANQCHHYFILIVLEALLPYTLYFISIYTQIGNKLCDITDFNIASMLTFSKIFFLICGIILISRVFSACNDTTQSVKNLILIIAYFLGPLTDIIDEYDGKISRINQCSSNFGNYLDHQIADKMGEFYWYLISRYSWNEYKIYWNIVLMRCILNTDQLYFLSPYHYDFKNVFEIKRLSDNNRINIVDVLYRFYSNYFGIALFHWYIIIASFGVLRYLMINNNLKEKEKLLINYHGVFGILLKYEQLKENRNGLKMIENIALRLLKVYFAVLFIAYKPDFVFHDDNK